MRLGGWGMVVFGHYSVIPNFLVVLSCGCAWVWDVKTPNILMGLSLGCGFSWDWVVTINSTAHKLHVG